jgi:solute carrier family 25 (mitochondrial phosphate transporter), member 3
MAAQLGNLGESSGMKRRRSLMGMLTLTTMAVCIGATSTLGFVPSSQVRMMHHNSKTAAIRDGRLWQDRATTDPDDPRGESEPNASSRRRQLLHTVLLATAAIPFSPAQAGVPELDQSGNLFTPKSEMIRGGSDAARGVSLATRSSATVIKPGQTMQTVYETRFIAYLSRFLLTFDPAANAWWAKQGLGDSWEQAPTDTRREEADARFAEFAESVEVGLTNYFVGPYGSYSSVAAAKAGLTAEAPAISARTQEEKSIWELLFPKETMKRPPPDGAKQGVLNLYALLKARYTSTTAKRQLAILFSCISSPQLQPVSEIRSLLGEADNGTITKIRLQLPPAAGNEAQSRTSSRRGGGYSIHAPPIVEIDAPPALGDDFHPAKARPIMKQTSRVLRIRVTDGGNGYTSPPAVLVTQGGRSVPCEAAAILDRQGRVESILVLDPGYGYGLKSRTTGLPVVLIETPVKPPAGSARKISPAKAVAELEYELAGLELLSGGNGYVATEPPKITITTPAEDPDWYVTTDVFGLQQSPEKEDFEISALVVEMILGDGTVVSDDFGENDATIDPGLLSRLKREPLELLPSKLRPELQPSFSGVDTYHIPYLPPILFPAAVPSPRYRAYDPIFGAVGRVPVTKGAMQLKASEYSRLALSGALCTVFVRTLLNPLELVKTKIQLNNDKELNTYAYSKMSAKLSPKSSHKHNETGVVATKLILPETTKTEDKMNIGTIDMISSLVQLRGFSALFQSADITFLASLVFGSFGFGATELFRRSFSMAFSSPEEGELGSEIILLTAAALACVVTSAAAAPFEVLRVKSMGLVESSGWKEVLRQFIVEKRGSNSLAMDTRGELDLTKLKSTDVLPLWNGFAPTVSRELPFAVTKFLAFDLVAKALLGLVNSGLDEGAIPVQVGTGSAGLFVSAISGALAGVAGAFVSHPADLILTLTSAKTKSEDGSVQESPDWKEIVKDLLAKEGGIANLFLGLPARSIFFFLVIGLQFFLYDYVKNVFEVGSDDLTLVLDVFYAVRQGLVDMANPIQQ